MDLEEQKQQQQQCHQNQNNRPNPNNNIQNDHQQAPGPAPPPSTSLNGGTGIIFQAGTAASSSSQGSGMDDRFHCHNRGEEDGDGECGERRKKSGEGGNKRASRVLWLSVGVCLFFMIGEVVGGLMAQSLAIITDAAHLLTDLASMLISLFSIYLANRPASQRMSFGWHRAEVVGAFISVFLIWVVTGVLVYLAIDRIVMANYHVDALIMSITAGVGVAVNLIMGLLLYVGGHSHSHSGGGGHQLPAAQHQQQQRRSSRARGQNGGIGAGGRGAEAALYQALGTGEEEGEEEDENERQPLVLGPGDAAQAGRHKKHEHAPSTNINVRAAFVHVLGDLIQSVGVLLAGLLILWKPHWEVLDPICTLLFSLIVLSTTIYIVRDALVVLLEGRPSNIDFALVFNALETIEGVKKVHDLRIWALTMNKVAISVHLEVEACADSQQILRATTRMLRRDFNVHESTVQIEGYQPESENCHQCVIPAK